MKRMAMSLALLAQTSLVASSQEPALSLSLAFSTDGGQTFSTDFPQLPGPAEVAVRVNWRVSDPTSLQDVILLSLSSESADFASANVGPQNWEGAKRWYQKPVPGWFSRTTEGATLILDTRFRPEGKVGHQNKWDRTRNQYIDGPLPACASLGKGQHKFTVRAYYKHARTQANVAATQEFFVTLLSADEHNVLPNPEVKPVVKPLATGLAPTEVVLPQADHVLRGADLAPCVPSDRLTMMAAFAKSRHESAWRFDGLPDGRYFLGLFTLIGDGSGAKHLGVQQPWLYVNGRAVQFATCNDPVDVTGLGVFGELYSADAIELKRGDELRLAETVSQRWTAQLALYKARPASGPLDVRPFVDPESDDLFRPEATLSLPADPNAKAQAHLKLVNVCGRASSFQASYRIVDYFQELHVIGGGTVTLDNRGVWDKDVEFSLGRSDRYRVILTVKDAAGNQRESVAEVLVDATLNDCRAKLWLNGEWEFLALPPGTEQLGPPPNTDAGWKKKAFPGFWPHEDYTTPNNNHCAWARRTFTLPTWMSGPRLIAVFNSVDYEAVVYVNGKLAGQHFGPKDPFEIDITDFVKREGTNELLIGMRDSTLAAVKDGQQIATGSRACGYISDVEILAQPAVAVTDVSVRTSFRQKSLTVDCTVPESAVGYGVQQAVYFEGKQVLALPDATVGADGRATSTAAWSEPILWDLGAPKLLRLDTRLVDAKGTLVDLRQTRFGFREIWPEGQELRFNGRPIKLRAYAMDNGWSNEQKSRADSRRRARQALVFGGQAKMHGADWHGMMDVADEEGLMLAQNIAGPSGPTRQIIESDEYWRNMELFATRCVAQFKNHPCIVEWKLSNEFSEHSDTPEKATERLQALGEAVRKLDRSRLIEFSCDLDLRGWADIISTHYPVDLGALRTATAYLPDAILWRPQGTPFTPGMKVPSGQVTRVANVKGESPMAWGGKPILVNETGWNIFYGPLGGFAAVAGDAVYRSPWAAEEAHTTANEWFMAGHRDAGVSLICPWQNYASGAMLRTLPPIDVFPLTRHTRWYAGQDVVWDVNLHHDVQSAQELALTWELAGPGFKTVSNRITRAMQPAELYRTRVAFKVPDVAEDTAGTLTLTVSVGGQTVRERTFGCRIFTKRALRWPKEGVALFDPKGGTRQKLAHVGFAPQPMTSLSAESLQRTAVLVIGEDCAAEAAAAGNANVLRDFVRQGGQVLVLHQTDMDGSWLPMGVTLSTKNTSIGFVRAPASPLLRGFGDDDFRFWYPDPRISSQDFMKPRLGNATPLVDAGLGNNDMEYTPLLEMAYGKGTYLLSQLRLVATAGVNPVADRLLEQMLAVLVQRQAVLGRTAITSATGTLATTLRKLGLVSEPFDPERTPPANQIIVDARAEVTEPLRRALKGSVAKGAVVLIHGIEPDDAVWLSELLEQKITVTPPTLKEWKGRLIRRGEDPLLDGISNADLFWRRNPKYEDVGSVYTQDSYLEDILCEYVVASETGQALTFPSALVKVKAGKGVVVMDTTRWDNCDPVAQRKAERVASLLLTNLGCELQGQYRKEWLISQSYAVIDLSAVLNRGLIDEVMDDGQGGWTDQGPKADMREFVPGKHTFHGVPFEVLEGKSCIVLASKNRKPTVPQQVQIPVNRKAKALYFLQSSAWTSLAHHASYFVHYADGSVHEIQLVGGENLRDWVAGNATEPFPFEAETYTRHAWAGSCEQFKQAHLFVMQWVNPKPDVAIARIDFVSTNEGVPILVGVTAGFDNAQKAITEEDRQAGAKVFVAAIAALDKGRQEEAEGLLKQAIALMPDNLEAYARLGALYEKQKLPTQAEAVYRASLGINPNQPTMYEALKRVER